MTREAFKAQEPELREELLDIQFRLKNEDLSVVIVLAGVEAAGKGEMANRLLKWLDARGVETHAIAHPTEDERERPRFYRFWKRLPPHGKVGLFLGSWYTRPIVDRCLGKLSPGDFEQALNRITQFENLLAHEGVLLIKFWLHIPETVQRKRLKKLEADPETAWRVTDREWRFHELYDKFRVISDDAIRRTSTEQAPWQIIEATDKRYRDMTAGQLIKQIVEERLANPLTDGPRRPDLPEPEPINILRSLDLDQSVEEEAYQAELSFLQGRLGHLSRELQATRRSVVMVFEGMDAAGKGGAIRRITQALDARFYAVHSIAAPTDEERARPYLWRFWRHIPRRAHFSVFDRSWYGRVLVERIEGFCTIRDWQRGYAEINAFEDHMVRAGVILVKFWLQISDEEQLKRFKDRESTGFKRHKLTDEDWRNRDKSQAYEAAICDMIERTSTHIAPWNLIEANDKLFARLKVLRTLCDAIDDALNADPMPADHLYDEDGMRALAARWLQPPPKKKKKKKKKGKKKPTPLKGKKVKAKKKKKKKKT